jgi:hypothetical protein
MQILIVWAIFVAICSSNDTYVTRWLLYNAKPTDEDPYTITADCCNGITGLLGYDGSDSTHNPKFASARGMYFDGDDWITIPISDKMLVPSTCTMEAWVF